jgi:hypothetical protein
MSLQTTLATEVMQYKNILFEEQTMNKEKPLIYREGTRRPTVSKIRRIYNQGKPEIRAVYQGNTSSYVRCAILTATEND